MTFNGAPSVDQNGNVMISFQPYVGPVVFNGTPAVDSNGNLMVASTSGPVSGIYPGPVEVTAATATFNTNEIYVGVNFAGAVTLSLPSGSTLVAGKFFIIKDESGAAATNHITINANGTDKIDGQSSAAIATNYGSLTLMWTGSTWSNV